MGLLDNLAIGASATAVRAADLITPNEFARVTDGRVSYIDLQVANAAIENAGNGFTRDLAHAFHSAVKSQLDKQGTWDSVSESVGDLFGAIGDAFSDNK